MPAGGKMMRENVATTSAEPNGMLSWNFTPSRSLKLYVLPSGEIFQLSARSGMIVLSPSAGLSRTRLLYICPRMKRYAPWCTSKCATSAGPAHLSTPPRLGFGSAARARSERTAAFAGFACLSDHAVSAAPAVVPAAVLRNRLRFTLSLPLRRRWFMSQALLWVARREGTRGVRWSSTSPCWPMPTMRSKLRALQAWLGQREAIIRPTCPGDRPVRVGRILPRREHRPCAASPPFDPVG